MIKIGITGGIGSGKSIVASIFQVMKIPVYIADEESKRLTDTSPMIREKLIDLFGHDLYSAKGLNRPLLASYIFNSPQHLQKVNSIIHPEVNRHFQDWANRQKGDICAIESAILFESGFDKIVDYSLMVYAPLELRIERISKRNGMAREDIQRRIQSQLSDEIKKEKSSFVICNDNDSPLIPQVQGIVASLRSH